MFSSQPRTWLPRPNIWQAISFGVCVVENVVQALRSMFRDTGNSADDSNHVCPLKLDATLFRKTIPSDLVAHRTYSVEVDVGLRFCVVESSHQITLSLTQVEVRQRRALLSLS